MGKPHDALQHRHQSPGPLELVVLARGILAGGEDEPALDELPEELSRLFGLPLENTAPVTKARAKGLLGASPVERAH